MENTKKCTKCSQLKDTDDYYVVAKTGYVYPYCKKCHYGMTKPTAKRWRKNNKKRWSEDVYKAQRAMFRRDKKGVYLVVTDKGMYVGQTDKYKNRMWQHKNSNFPGNIKHKGANIISSILLVEENDYNKRRALEKVWIRTLRPTLNLLHNPDVYPDNE